MSNITVNVTNAGTTNLAVSNGSTFNATVGNGGSVSVGIGSISPGNATVVSGTLTINSTTTLAAGSNATVTNNGTAYAAVLDFGIPAGGFSNISVGNVTTLSPGSSATVASAANGGNVALSFGLPAGPAPAFAIGKVTTLNAGSSANVTLSTANNGANVTLDFGIPRGVDGTGTSNVQLSNAAPANLGTAAVGTSNLAARADHVHNVPVIAYADLSGVPANFPTNVTLVSGLSAAYAAANHAHSYVTTLNNLTGAITLAAGPNVTLSTSNLTITIDSTAGLGANDAIDGGNYTGEILGGITFSVQPQSVTVSTNSSVTFANVANSPARYAVFSLGTNLYSMNVSNWLIRSSDDGATWSNLAATNISSTNMAIYPASAFSNGTRTVFAPGLIGNGSSGMFYSDDANLTTFTALATGGGYPDPRSLAYSSTAGRWVVSEAPDGGYPALYSSSNATTWTLRKTFSTLANATRVNVVTCAGLFLAMPNNYDDYEYSSDGISWTSASNPFTGPGGVIAIASNGTRAVAVQGTAVRVTTNGTTWDSATLPVACQFVQYARNLFWAWTSSTVNVFTSQDGISWTTRELSKAGLRGIAAASGSNTAFLAYDSSISVNLSTQANAVFTSKAASATFTALASASSGAAVSYQWQQSLDAGSTWSNVANQTATSLNLTGLTLAESGTRYRAQASATGAATQSSQTAILTVTE